MTKLLILILLFAAFSAGCVLRDYATVEEIQRCKSLPPCEYLFGRYGGLRYPQVQCMADLALNRSDPSLCDELSHSTKSCEEKVILEATWQKDYCYYLLAENSQDYKICSNVKDESRRDACYSDLAIIARNGSICDLIVNKSLAEDCYEEYCHDFFSFC